MSDPPHAGQLKGRFGGGRSGSAAFFSGGVDSFSTALSHLEDLAALVFVHGFDISIERTLLLARMSTALHLAGDELGTPVLDVETDIRRFSSGLLTWGEYHGAALAATALLLGSAFPTVFVPGSLSWDCVHPYGSHPALDPLFSTRAVGIVYDGFDHNRAAKTRAICASATALRWLRVCNSRDDFGYNCGRCEKCLRTMIGLRIAGQRLPLPSFPSDLDLSAVASRTVLRQRDLWEQNLDAAVRAGTDLPLIAALRASLSLHRSDMARQ